MSDVKKYYYLKVKENFFFEDEVILLENMQDGYKYICILLKLYLKSLKFLGKLSFSEDKHYDIKMLSSICNVTMSDMEKALKIFLDLDLIKIFENGDIYMTRIQNYIRKIKF